MKTNLYITLSAFAMILFSACSHVVNDDADEDYDKLFPFKGIEKPKISYDDQALQLASIDMNEQSYVYPGVEISGEKRTYTVTLSCSFFEKELQGSLVPDGELSSTYTIRYIDADNTLKTIFTKSYGFDDSEVKLLKNGEEQKITFQAMSGFPMFLQVKGGGPSNSSVRATISAVSNDGLTIVRPLHVEQFQNEEGINLIKNPFCGYIILP